MDRLLYTAMTGALHTMNQQATTAHNLANATTTGYRTQIDSFRAVPVISEGLPTRTFVVDAEVATDFKLGPIQHTGRTLDLALLNKGWLVVEMPDGSEAYTRMGSLTVTPEGLLQTREGLNVLGTDGPIELPIDVPYTIDADGTIATYDNTTTPRTVAMVALLRFVNPPEDMLVRGTDGLFRMKDGSVPEDDPGVKLLSGALESSNVNVAETLVNIISLSRQFEMQMQMIRRADENAGRASNILSLSS
jgi:flagellar basal-body rod protein FlgF